MYNICVKLTIDNTTTVDINYKALYGCKWGARGGTVG